MNPKGRWEGGEELRGTPIFGLVRYVAGATPYNGLHGEAPPRRGTFFRLQGYERVG